MDTTYDGWTNYATWRVAFEWFEEDDHIHRIADGCNDASELSERIQRYVWDSFYEWSHGDNSMFSDYALSFLEDVNFDEIANNYWNDNKNTKE